MSRDYFRRLPRGWQSRAQEKRIDSIVWLLSGIMAIGMGVFEVSESARSVSWPSVEGVVQKCERVERRRNGTSRTEWYFNYTYIHDGIEYTSPTRSIPNSSTDTQYAKGTKVKVFFDPTNPQDSRLTRGISFAGRFLLLTGFGCVTWGVGAFIFEKLFFRIGLSALTVVSMHFLSQLYIDPGKTTEAMKSVEDAEQKLINKKALREYENKIRLEQMKLSGKFLISKSFMSSYEFREDGTGIFYGGFMIQFGKEAYEVPFTYKRVGDELEITQLENGAKLKALIHPFSVSRLSFRDVVAEKGVDRFLSQILTENILTRTEKTLAELMEE